MAIADLRWNDVRADFNDANQAMGNAMRGISQVGTVFGELRKSILDQEQRAIENAYRQKEFDERVRQFGEQQALNLKQFDENTRQFGLNYALNQERFKQQKEADAATQAYRMSELGLRKEENQLRREDNKLRQDKLAQELKAANIAMEQAETERFGNQLHGQYITANPVQQQAMMVDMIKQRAAVADDSPEARKLDAAIAHMDTIDSMRRATGNQEISAVENEQARLGFQAALGTPGVTKQMAEMFKERINLGLRQEEKAYEKDNKREAAFDKYLSGFTIDSQSEIKKAVEKLQAKFGDDLDSEKVAKLIEGTTPITESDGKKKLDGFLWTTGSPDINSAMEERILNEMVSGKITRNGKPSKNAKLKLAALNTEAALKAERDAARAREYQQNMSIIEGREALIDAELERLGLSY